MTKLERLKPSKPLTQITDPHNINARLARQVSELLRQLEEGEHVTLRERFQALMAIARIQFVFVNLRKEKAPDDTSGSAVRKYAIAFSKNDPGGRKKIARSTKPEPEPGPDDQWWSDDDDDNAA